MSKPYLNSTELIKSVKRRASIPANQVTFTDEDFLAFANEEMQEGIIPLVLSTHEEYFVTESNVPLENDKQEYSIPNRAIGSKLRDLHFRDRTGLLYDMARVSLENKTDNNVMFTQVSNVYQQFYVKGNKVVLLSDVQGISGEQLEFSYYRRPNNLVTLDRVATIININRTSGVITFDKIPTNFSSSAVYDFVQVEPPHDILGMDATIIAISTANKTITFDTDDIPDDLIVGDTVLLAGETYVPNIPTELHVLLAHRVAARCLESMNDSEGLKNANLKLQEMEGKTVSMIEDRVTGAPLKALNRNSFLRRKYRG